jgi:homoaconitate hydratase
MGSKTAEAYLASPAVVAASAIAGSVAMPFEMETAEIKASIDASGKPEGGPGKVTIIDGFPEVLEGDVLFCHLDNLNTDGIYPGKYTYIDDFTPQQQAGVVMENYDPEFGKIAKEGDILVGGFNFGTGSSREQAATALKYRGISLVIAGSFSETYKRNALNNGFLTIEVPELVSDLKAKHGSGSLTVATRLKAKVDFGKSQLEFDGKTYSIAPVGAAAQELILTDGLENWVKKNL